jgi:hypothetical protein
MIRTTREIYITTERHAPNGKRDIADDGSDTKQRPHLKNHSGRPNVFEYRR